MTPSKRTGLLTVAHLPLEASPTTTSTPGSPPKAQRFNPSGDEPRSSSFIVLPPLPGQPGWLSPCIYMHHNSGCSLFLVGPPVAFCLGETKKKGKNTHFRGPKQKRHHILHARGFAMYRFYLTPTMPWVTRGLEGSGFGVSRGERFDRGQASCLASICLSPPGKKINISSSDRFPLTPASQLLFSALDSVFGCYDPIF